MCAIERNVRTNRGKGEDGPPIYLEPVNSKHNLKISSLHVRGSVSSKWKSHTRQGKA